MRYAFSTITTQSHLPQVHALYQSLNPWLQEIDFYVLVVDGVYKENDSGVKWLDEKTIRASVEGDATWKRYGKKSQRDQLRWSLKPVLMLHLLQAGYDRVIHLDNDLFFFSDPRFLFEEMDQGHVLLTPHWRTLDPEEDVYEFRNNFTDGIYNAGFVGATQSASAALHWWAKVCRHRIDKGLDKGYFLDQRYLDLLPTYFPPARILPHQGCNVAFWNLRNLKHVEVDGEVLINGKWPIVFIHFTHSLIKTIMEAGQEHTLASHLHAYKDALSGYDPDRGLHEKLGLRSGNLKRFLDRGNKS